MNDEKKWDSFFTSKESTSEGFMADRETAKRFDKVFEAALDLFEDAESAQHWMERPVRGLGDRRPVDMLDTDEDAEAVIRLIMQLQWGIFP